MRRAVICFTRVPRAGQTKTRLLPVLTPEQCADLHRAFLRDLRRVYGSAEADLLVAYTPDADWRELEGLLPEAAAFFPQEGEDLGARMHNALCRAFSLGYEAALLTGSDLPELHTQHLTEAFAALCQTDVVLGPTSDGGYYLVGLKDPCPEIFEGHRYGGSTVLESTLAAVKAAGLTAALAPACDDVDTPEDLSRVAGILSPHSAVSRFLKETGYLK